MSKFNRRHFLQFAASTLATLGLSQFDFLARADRYGRVLAQGTPRKIALLIGINGYPDLIGRLNGCLTDVELQRQLLMHRFGFKAEDIYELSDNTPDKPTRENILAAFALLRQQVKPGDVVVVHYSGHGSRIQDPNPIDTPECRAAADCNLNGTLVPIDGLPISQNDRQVIVPDIMGRSLFLMTKAIDTDFLTVVLDSCHSGAGTRGNANVRAARDRRDNSNRLLLPSEAELEQQAEWLATLRMNAADFQAARQRSIARGVVIGSAQRNELAVDASFDGFHAGGFTYLLTRYLWQQSTQHSAKVIYANLQISTKRLANEKGNNTSQVPIFEYQPEANQDKPLYFTPLESASAEAVITSAGSEVEFWLGGVSSQNLQGSGKGTVFNILDATGKVIGEIEQTRRNGLYGYGQLKQGEANAVQPGRLLRERILGIPTNPVLKVGLDPSLEPDLETARTELSQTKNIEVVNVAPGIPMDYLLGRLTEDYQQQLRAAGLRELPPLGSVGLFSADRSSLLFDTFGRVDEPVIAAINRLQPRLRVLLANQLLGELLSAGRGSPLQVTASIAPQDNPRNRLQLASRGSLEASSQNQATAIPPQFRRGTPLKIAVNNQENEDLYVGVIIVMANGNLVPLYPNAFDVPEESAQLAANGELTIPGPSARYQLTVEGSSGFPEFLILASKEPLANALKALGTIAATRGTSPGQPVGELNNEESFGLINALLGDLTNLTRSAQADGGVRPQLTGDSVPYDTSTLAVLSGVFEVVA